MIVFYGAAVEFGYSGDKGPDKWGSLDPKFKTCSDGKAQSPIDIVRSKATRDDKLRALARDYHSANAVLVNNGFNIGVSCGLKFLKTFTIIPGFW